MISNYDITTTPHLMPDTCPPDPVQTAQSIPEQQNPVETCSIHVPLVVSTTVPVPITGDKSVFINQIVERLDFKINLITPSNQEVPMNATVMGIDVNEETMAIPLVLACRFNPKVKINNHAAFAKGLIDSINEKIAEYGCELNCLLPQIIEYKENPDSELLPD